MTKKLAFFTVALNEENAKYAKMMISSFQKFHPNETMLVFDNAAFKQLNGTDKDKLALTPFFARHLMSEYETVIRLDADQLILGDLNYLINSTCDIGTVLNINRVDPKQYGYVQFQGIAPNEYYNCGLVVMRSKKMVDHWHKLCKSKYFKRMRYGEQDILNIICHFGEYSVQCYDHYDENKKYYAWHGLVAKGEGMRMKVVGKGDNRRVVLSPDKDNYPDKQTTIKAYHWAGGGDAKKMNFRVHFSTPVIEYIEELIK